VHVVGCEKEKCFRENGLKYNGIPLLLAVK